VTTGSAVTWTNGTGATHTATADTGAWTTGNIGTGPTEGPVTFNTPGTFAYHCAIHPFMMGSVVVNAVTPPSTAPTASAAPIVVGLALLRPGSVRRRPHGR